ncbi:MAG TPA: hypothetical protein VLQ91_13005 [Draconibacterium sp.]|nr:hypothetical protein [Draconibacterium sp.]
MKRKLFIAFTVFLLFIIDPVFAQEQTHEARWEKIKAEKVAFLTTQLALTSAEAEKFWPVYNEMEQQRWDAQKARRELENKVSEAEESLSESEIVKLTRDFAGSMAKEGALMSGYNEKLLKVIPAKKVLKLYKAENEFRMNMIRKYRDSDKGDKGPK